MREAKGDTRVLPECQQGTMEESTWADSMDSVCEGGAACACSDRTRPTHTLSTRATELRVSLCEVSLGECEIINIDCEWYRYKI